MAEPAEDPRHPDERQAYESRRIGALDTLEQGDTEPLGLEAASAIERLLAGNVALDLVRAERSENDTRLVHVRGTEAARRRHHARRVEVRRGAAQDGELLARSDRTAGLVEDELARRSDLIAADHYRIGKPKRDGARLVRRESQGPLAWTLTRDADLVDPGALQRERNGQALEEHPAVGRGRGEDHAGHERITRAMRNKGLAGVRFDYRGGGPYHTRPMSEDWSKLRDVDLLADGRVRLDFAIPLAEFPRIRPQLARTDGRVTGHVSFDREQGLPIADVEVAGRAALICQRCLEPFELAVESEGRVALVADDAEAGRVPEELETILAPVHRIALRDLVEEELLLALPIVPRHAAEECGLTREEATEKAGAGSVARSRAGAADEASDVAGAPGISDEKHRPFERLNELLKRS